jgi:hypothetical protein
MLQGNHLQLPPSTLPALPHNRLLLANRPNRRRQQIAIEGDVAGAAVFEELAEGGDWPQVGDAAGVLD